MNEILEKLELQGKERQEALKKCREIVESWGLKVPEVIPSPLHFGLNDF